MFEHHQSSYHAGSTTGSQTDWLTDRQRKQAWMKMPPVPFRHIFCHPICLFLRSLIGKEVHYISPEVSCADLKLNWEHSMDSSDSHRNITFFQEGSQEEKLSANQLKYPRISCNILIYHLLMYHLNPRYCWPQVVRRIFMMFVDMRQFSSWQIQHQCSPLEAVMTDPDRIHKSKACGEGGWHWCMLGHWEHSRVRAKDKGTCTMTS